MDLLKLTIDRQAKALINRLGTPTTLPAFFQKCKPTLQIYTVDPTGNFNNPYTLVDMSSYSLRVSIGQTPTGTAGGPTPLIVATGFTWDTGGQFFTGDIDLTGVAIDSFVGSASSVAAFFEVNLADNAGNRSTILQSQITLKAVVDELTAVAPVSSDRYLPLSDQLSIFVKRVGAPGERIVLPNASGTGAVELGCNDDGSFLCNRLGGQAVGSAPMTFGQVLPFGNPEGE